jgi:transcriptional regulator with XRE-family HTH domain
LKTLSQFIEEQTEREPTFAEHLAVADAEVRLALVLARLREARGMTQRQLAARLGVTQSVVARYEKAGRTPTVAVLWRYAQVLQTNFILGPSFLIKDIEENEASESREHPRENTQPIPVVWRRRTLSGRVTPMVDAFSSSATESHLQTIA